MVLLGNFVISIHQALLQALCKIRFGVQECGNDLKNRVDLVGLWRFFSWKNVGDVVIWMVEDIFPDLPSASGINSR